MQVPSNLAEVSIECVADLVEQGLKQLGEVPATRRDQVANELKRRALEAEVELGEPDEPAAGDRKAELTALTIAELLVIVRSDGYASITSEHSMRKAQLVDAILDAEGEQDASEE